MREGPAHEHCSENEGATATITKSEYDAAASECESNLHVFSW
jgi:hypothetical protein